MSEINTEVSNGRIQFHQVQSLLSDIREVKQEISVRLGGVEEQSINPTTELDTEEVEGVEYIRAKIARYYQQAIK